MTRTCDKNINEFTWILTPYERRPRVGEKRHNYILENTLYTNDTHLFNFFFFMVKNEIINWKPKNGFML